jgi:TM2 domain-containing membrane protein YozV
MNQPGQSIWWRIDQGGFPGCPVGTVVSFVNDADSAKVIRQGVGQIGLLHSSTTTQVASADGRTITLTNPTEGWSAVLSQASSWSVPPATVGTGKSRIVAAALALILGGIGAHKFYLGKVALGVVYLLFSWTGIPSLIAWIEGITYLAKSNEAWAQEYGGSVETPSSLAIGCLWIVALLPFLFIFGIVALIFLGGQVSAILSNVGTSV